MVQEPLHVKQLSPIPVCKIGLMENISLSIQAMVFVAGGINTWWIPLDLNSWKANFWLIPLKRNSWKDTKGEAARIDRLLGILRLFLFLVRESFQRGLGYFHLI